MITTFSHLGIVIRLKGRIIFHYVVSCIDQCIPENPGATFRHSGVAGIEITRLIYGRIQSGKCKQLTGLLEAMNIANLAQDHIAIDITNAGDGHYYGIESEHDFGHLRFDILDLPVQ